MSFGELFIIAVIALIVLGPERLPKAARTVGLWIGKAKRSFDSIKNEIDRELKVKELQEQLENQKRILEQQSGLNSLQESQDSLQQMVKETVEPVATAVEDLSSVQSSRITQDDAPTKS